MAIGRSPAIRVTNLSAGYNGRAIVHAVDLEVGAGEFVAVLGSSGCGKTTLLRTIAGFQPALGGHVHLFDRDVTELPPERRDVAMVFQSYALWPHMTVLGNIGYGLKLRGVGRAEIRAEVERILDMLNLAGLADRKVVNLSGGQRQRVALGRALAIAPKILLLDEPLSNLDAKVRLQLRGEIKSLQRKLGFAAIHVTHDREEAMTMADRIVVMDQGRIVQQGCPEDVYDRPSNPFIATFMGADNTIDVVVTATPDGSEIRAPGAKAPVRFDQRLEARKARAYFREDAAQLITDGREPPATIVLPAEILSRAYPGGHYRYAVAVGDRTFTVNDTELRNPGTPVSVGLAIKDLHIFPIDP